MNTIISVSKGNSKMGDVPSFSLPAGHVADGGSCLNASSCAGKFDRLTGSGGCYAMKSPFTFPAVKNAYARNMASVLGDPQSTADQINAYLTLNGSVKFRFDVSGDTITEEYRDMQIDIAAMNPDVKFIKYTKVYGFYKKLSQPIPENMSVMFSWFVDVSRDLESQLNRFMRYSGNSTGKSYPMAITSLDALSTFKALRKLGRKPALCPAQTMGKDIINCDRCNLCFDANRKGIDVIFQHHAVNKDELEFRAKYHGEFKQLRMI